MRRRAFLGALAGMAWPLAARAQQPGKIWRLGFIAHSYESFYDGRRCFGIRPIKGTCPRIDKQRPRLAPSA